MIGKMVLWFVITVKCSSDIAHHTASILSSIITYNSVSSGVPQGTVLGPLMFLIYINDITENISSQLRLFADDCLLYCVIKTEQDSFLLQKDLDALSQWALSGR